MLKNILITLFILSNVYALKVGEVSMLRGKAVIHRGNIEIKAKIKTSIDDKDIIKTEPNSKIQLTFIDDTVITLGEETTFKVQEYVNENQNPKAKFSVTEGSFKVITGKIGKLAPKNFLLKTKTSLIGVRGTIFAGKVGISNGDYVACLRGSIYVTSLKNGDGFDLDRGEAIFIKDDGSTKIQKLNENDFTTLSHLEKSSTKTDEKEDTKSENDSSDEVSSNKSTTSQTSSQRDVQATDDSFSTTNTQIATDENKITQDEATIEDVKLQSTDINSLIENKTILNYKGTLSGTSTAKYTTSSSATNLTANLQADMEMRVDFGGNDPLRVDITNQKLNLTSASVDGTALSGDDLNDLKAQLSSTNNFTSSMQMTQNIDPSTSKITGNYTKTENGFTTNAKLDGDFKDNKASGITGSLTESTSGSANGVSIDRDINANFDVDNN